MTLDSVGPSGVRLICKGAVLDLMRVKVMCVGEDYRR